MNLHNNTELASTTQYWSGIDSQISWETNIKKNPSFFIENGWDKIDSIVYKYNSDGFRCREFDNTPSYVALGCSFTEGVGLNEDEIWPTILSKRINYPILNLGVGGSSLDTCYRLLKYYLNNIPILGVFVLITSRERIEIFGNDNTPSVILPTINSADHRYHFYKEWISSEYNVIYQTEKNIDAIRYLCHLNNIKCFFVTYGDLATDKARDMAHPGRQSHINYTDMFLKLFKEK